MNRKDLKEWHHKNKDLIRCVSAACFIIFFYFVLMNFTAVTRLCDKLLDVCSPFIFGAIIAYLLRPICNGIKNILNKVKLMRNSPKTVNLIAVTLSVLIGIGMLVLLCLAIVPPLLKSIENIVETLPGIVENVVEYVQQLAKENETIQNVLEELWSRADKVYQNEIMPTVTEIVDIISESALGIFDILKTFFIGIIAAIYLLADKSNIKERIIKFINRNFEAPTAKAICAEMTFADKTFTRYITGTFIDAIIVGVTTYIFAIIAGMPSPILLAATIAVTNVIPIVGPFIGAIPTALIVLAYAPDKFLMYCIFLLILQQIDGHILVPKVLGTAVGISGLTALVAIIVGGGLFGLPGMVLGVPVVTVCLDIWKKIGECRAAKRKQADTAKHEGGVKGEEVEP